MSRYLIFYYLTVISVKDSKFIEAPILRCLLITCTSKISEISTLKLTFDLMIAWQLDWYYLKCSIAFLTLFQHAKCIEIASLKSWLHFGGKGVSHHAHIPPGRPNFSSPFQFFENHNVVRTDPGYLQRKLSAFTCQL